MQQKIKGAFDRLSQTSLVMLIMQMTFTSAYHHSDMQALAMELASTATILGVGWVGGCMHACVRVSNGAWDIHISSHLGSSCVSTNQLLNKQGEIENDTVIVLTKN